MTSLCSFSEKELADLLELTRYLGYMPKIDMEHVNFDRRYGLELRLIPVEIQEEE